jgi:hypothetical protein
MKNNPMNMGYSTILLLLKRKDGIVEDGNNEFSITSIPFFLMLFRVTPFQDLTPFNLSTLSTS